MSKSNWKKGLTKSGSIKYTKFINGSMACAVLTKTCFELGCGLKGTKHCFWVAHRNIQHRCCSVNVENIEERLNKVEIYLKKYEIKDKKLREKYEAGIGAYDDDEQKAYEDMKPHEQVAEIGRREIIKFEKEKKLTESEYDKLSKEFDKFLGLDK